MMDIRRAAALLLALVMIAALTVGCGKKQSDTPTDTPAAGADGRTPAQQPAKLVCYNGSVTLRFVREEDTWYWAASLHHLMWLYNKVTFLPICQFLLVYNAWKIYYFNFYQNLE